MGGTGAVVRDAIDDPDGGAVSDTHVEVLGSVAEVIYPSAVTVDEEFIRTYVTGRSEDRPTYRTEVREGLERIQRAGTEWYGAEFVSLSPEIREDVLERIGVKRVPPRPGGRTPERIRYYIINDLLYALYTTPVGGALLGRSNPQGYPGGLESYQRGSE